MFGDGPAHDSVNRAETTLSPTTVSGLHVVATYPGWVGAETDYQLIVGNFGYAVTSSGPSTYITAFHLPSGAKAWHHQLSGPRQGWLFAPAVSGTTLVVGGDSKMYAFNATTGAKEWAVSVASGDSDFNEVTVANNIVYADTYYGAPDGTLYAFNLATGRVIWSATPPGCCLVGAVSVSGALAYVSTSSGLLAYNAATGAPAFTAAVAEVTDTVAVSGGVAFVQSPYEMQALNATTGALLWTAALDNYPGESPPAVDGNVVVASTGHSLIALAASTGARLWTVSDGYDYSVPSIANGVVYGAALLDAGTPDQGLQAISEATGHVLYAGDTGCENAVVSDARVYADCSAGETVWGL
jgi:outer membrane protein assembly factor BamB